MHAVRAATAAPKTSARFQSSTSITSVEGLPTKYNTNPHERMVFWSNANSRRREEATRERSENSRLSHTVLNSVWQDQSALFKGHGSSAPMLPYLLSKLTSPFARA